MSNQDPQLTFAPDTTPANDSDNVLRALTDRTIRKRHVPSLTGHLAEVELTRLARKGPAEPAAVLRILLSLVPTQVADAALRALDGRP